MMTRQIMDERGEGLDFGKPSKLKCGDDSIRKFTDNLVAVALTSPQDISALQAFKASVKPSSIQPWSCLASWDFTTDPCAFPRRTHFTCGITCSPDSTRITQLTLDPAGYSGQLTPLISQLASLTILDLADNSFYGPYPLLHLFAYQPPDLDSAFQLVLWRELALKANSLSGSLSKSSFDRLTQLEVVELSENSFTGTLEPWFFLLPALQQVDLSNNSLARVEISKPSNATSDLVAVDLGFNKIEGNAPLQFADYPLLSSLSLRYNRLRGTIPLEYGRKKSLRRLFLDGNFLIGKPPPAFFASDKSVSGSLGDNCLEACPGSFQLCMPSQKPSSVCKQAYGGKPRS
ncbi:hypothetical protein OIU85_001689 [Salix viminalis]|uniref:Leucine-rich repeat-containing N-terminal plant-type domain-containing protein n=1 Tax=Salix viminalis TaxID=40686 RepID=A0A9Q0VMG9_SALVM|nr:hypothetical protein OIU85_001689 [Salix viminalis]